MRKKRRFFIILALLFFFALFEATALTYFRICNTKPDLVLLLVIMLGLYNSLEEGVLYGLLAGILCSFFSTAPVYAFCLAYGLSGLFAGLVKDKLHPDLYVVPLLTSSGGTLLSSLIFIFSGLAAGMNLNSAHTCFHLFILVLMNSALAIPMAWLARSGLLTAKRPLE